MSDSIINRIEQLETANRRWKTISFVLAAILLSVLTTGLTFFGLAHQRSMTAMEEAMQNKAAARQNAVERERALRAIQAERALQEANEQK